MKTKNFFSESYIRQGGRILPFGVIRTLANSVVDPPADDHAGLAHFSSKLLPYGNGKYYANIEGNKIAIFLKENSKKVKTIPVKNMSTGVDIDIAKVEEMGYLNVVGMFGLGLFTYNSWPDNLEALRVVAAGKPALFIDNSAFTQVDEKMIGSELILIEIRETPEPCHKVFTLTGKFVKSRVSYPLRIAAAIKF